MHYNMNVVVFILAVIFLFPVIVVGLAIGIILIILGVPYKITRNGKETRYKWWKKIS